MSSYRFEDYTFEALCLDNGSPVIDTLAYVVGLVDSENHAAANPDTARYDILCPLSECEGYVDSGREILGMQAEFLPANYWPQTPVIFARRWSPITAMLEKGIEPVNLTRKTEKAPHAIATGIWRPGIAPAAKEIDDCTTDEELFWAIMNQVFTRASGRGLYINILAEVGWAYESQIGSLQVLSKDEIEKSGRVLWQSTVDG
jgi:hypothetical protein